MENEKEVTKISWKKRLIRMGIGLVAGALLGYAYYYFIGCNSGSCSITASPVNSVLYGMLIGGVISYK
ncbi:DUF6132 family protein [Alkaliflexus imshenetskii]|uniref:DUF6132 family protein n=1 Tax=Alkaliflexus imshenetskii TaxID=286730 RepID=UPI00047C7DDE|nr:DUF6132 family protein [Alkaliflexus imshenetskii]